MTVSIVLAVCVAVGNPGADTVIVAVPIFTPLIVGCVVGAVAPAGMVTVVVGSFTLVASLLDRVTTTPFGEGAGTLKLTGKLVCAPTVTFTGLAGKIRNGGLV